MTKLVVNASPLIFISKIDSLSLFAECFTEPRFRVLYRPGLHGNTLRLTSYTTSLISISALRKQCYSSPTPVMENPLLG